MAHVPVENKIRVGSFNLFAPCWNRRFRRPDRSHPGAREMDFPSIWQPRNEKIVSVINTLQCDVLCLQEYWFDDEFKNLFKSHLNETYEFVELKRTASHKPDGICTLVNRESFDIIAIHPVTYDFSNRVALISVLQSKSMEDLQIALVNTHLTHPEDEYDHQKRKKQIEELLLAIDTRVTEHNEADDSVNISAAFLCGDFNSNIGSPVAQQILQANFESTFRTIHSYLQDEGYPVTHISHHDEEMSCDFIFKKVLPGSPRRIIASDAHLYPVELPVDTFPATEDFDISDHRPLIGDFLVRETEVGE